MPTDSTIPSDPQPLSHPRGGRGEPPQTRADSFTTAEPEPGPSAEVADGVAKSHPGGRLRPSLPGPLGLRLLVLALLASPAIHLVCFLLGVRFLNYGGRTAWDAAIYVVIAPAVGLLLLFHHERARFSAYVFLSCEIVRGIKIHSAALVVLAAAAIVYFQTPRARAVFPRIDPAAVRRRLRSYVPGRSGRQDHHP